MTKKFTITAVAISAIMLAIAVTSVIFSHAKEPSNRVTITVEENSGIMEVITTSSGEKGILNRMGDPNDTLTLYKGATYQMVTKSGESVLVEIKGLSEGVLGSLDGGPVHLYEVIGTDGNSYLYVSTRPIRLDTL